MGRARSQGTFVVLVIAEDGTQSIYGTWRSEKNAERVADTLLRTGDGTLDTLDITVHQVMTP